MVVKSHWVNEKFEQYLVTALPQCSNIYGNDSLFSKPRPTSMKTGMLDTKRCAHWFTYFSRRWSYQLAADRQMLQQHIAYKASDMWCFKLSFPFESQSVHRLYWDRNNRLSESPRSAVRVNESLLSNENIAQLMIELNDIGAIRNINALENVIVTSQLREPLWYSRYVGCSKCASHSSVYCLLNIIFDETKSD